jgi:hypothetical protein
LVYPSLSLLFSVIDFEFLFYFPLLFEINFEYTLGFESAESLVKKSTVFENEN